MERKKGRPSILHPHTHDAIVDYLHGNPGAAISEIADALAIGIATCHKALVQLRDERRVSWTPHKKRTLRAGVMKTVKLHYVVIITGDITVKVPADAINPGAEAIRIAKATRPNLRGATFEVVEVATDATESDEAGV